MQSNTEADRDREIAMFLKTFKKLNLYHKFTLIKIPPLTTDAIQQPSYEIYSQEPEKKLLASFCAYGGVLHADGFRPYFNSINESMEKMRLELTEGERMYQARHNEEIRVEMEKNEKKEKNERPSSPVEKNESMFRFDLLSNYELAMLIHQANQEQLRRLRFGYNHVGPKDIRDERIVTKEITNFTESRKPLLSLTQPGDESKWKHPIPMDDENNSKPKYDPIHMGCD